MTKEEIKNLKLLIKLVEDVEQFANNADVLKKDNDGGYTHNSMALLFRISHIKRQLKESWKNDKLIIKDYE